MDKPKVSVVMTAYNSAQYIEESVLSVLNQTLKELELIIVNDCSTDNTPEIIKKLATKDSRIKIINNEINLQPALSRNKAIDQALGQYIAILDSDDTSLPERLKTQSEYLDDHPEVSLVGCAAQIINGQGEVIGQKKPIGDFSKIKFELLVKNQIMHSGVMYRKSAINEIGGYNNDYLHSEDYKLYSDLVKKSAITNLPQTLIQYRHSPGAISIATPTRTLQLEHAVQISLENLSNYIPIDKAGAQKLFNTINRRNLSLGGVLYSRKIYKILAASFIVKEKLNESESQEIQDVCQSEIKLMFRRYLKSRIGLNI